MLGPDAGVATVGGTVRYPDAFITCTKVAGTERLVRSTDPLVMSRTDADTDWTATALTAENTLDMPEIGISVPVAEFYDGLELPDPAMPDA